MNPPKILFLIKQKQGQSLYTNPTNRKPGLHNSINSLVTALVKHGINAILRDVPDRNGIHGVVCEVRPDVVVIEAYWVTPGKLQLLKVLHPNVHWIIRNHSEVPFLAEEGNSGTWNCEYLKMGVEVTSVSQRTVEDLSPLVENLGVDPHLLTHLPNVYLGDHIERRPVKDMPGDEIHIGCFGAIRSMKNHVQQSLAAISYATRANKQLFFHINGTRVESHGMQPLKNMRGIFDRMHNCEMVEHPWMEKDQFYDLLWNKIDVLLQCSLTESFNIVAADAVLCSVPVIASSEVRWLGKQYHANPNSVIDICSHLTYLFSGDRQYLEQYTDDQIDDLNSYNRRSIAIWQDRFL